MASYAMVSLSVAMWCKSQPPVPLTYAHMSQRWWLHANHIHVVYIR